MKKKYNSKVILITGASSGIGLNLAKHFLKEGMKVINISRNSAKIKNKNGKIDRGLIDDNENGKIDGVMIDKDENGKWELILIDKNEDGKVDFGMIDRDQDGKPDLIAFDDNGDKKWDRYQKL